MNHKAILYSLDPKTSFSHIHEIIDYDKNKYTKLQDRIDNHKVGVLLESEKDFHFKLLPIRPKLHICYYMGDISLLNKKILGIVGPRKMSLYGKQVVEHMFDTIPNYDIVTISGMAEGIDQLCHKLSCEKNIPTIAVLGGGLGRYLNRPEHTIIQQIVAAGGLILSEYKLGEKPSLYTFPQRNRVIAGLSDIVVLPEAGEKSGSLITVDYAIAMNKPVYATPNSIFSSTSAGILQRIELGEVKPIFDIAKLLATHFTSKNNSHGSKTLIILTDQEQLVWSTISRNQPLSLHDAVQRTGLDIQDMMQILTLLEIKGLVGQEEPGKYVSREK